MRSSTKAGLLVAVLIIVSVFFFGGQLLYGIHHGEGLRIVAATVVLTVLAMLLILPGRRGPRDPR